MADEKLYWPYDGGEPLRQVTNFPAGVTADSLYGYEFDGLDGQGVKKRVRTKKGMVTSEEQGIYADGTDMTARINAAFAKAKLKILEIEVPGGGEILVTGTVTIPNDKFWRIAPGTMIKTTGSGIITGGILSADPYSQIFSGTKNVNPYSTTTNYVSANWYGVGGVGYTPSTNADNANLAAQFIINSDTLPRQLYFPNATYSFNKPILLYKWNGTNYVQHYIEISGNNDGVMQGFGTTFYFDCASSFGIGIHIGKGCIIRRLAIVGTFWPTFSDMKAFVETRLTDFGASQGCLETQFATNGGVVIDPFRSSVPTYGGYPTLTSMYKGSITGSGSTMCQILNCTITNWMTNVAYSPNGQTQNCDCMLIADSTIGYCRYGVSYGQDQTRSCWIRNLQCWTPTHTVITNRAHGNQSGAPPDIDLLSIAGFVNQVFYIVTTGRAGFTATKIFAESVFRIGTIAGQPSSIRDSKFNFSLASNPGIGMPSPDLYGDLSGVTISDSLIINYDNLYNKRMNMNANNCTFINCRFDLPPLLQIQDTGTGTRFIDCLYGATIGAPFGVSSIEAQNSSYYAEAVQHGIFTISDKGVNAYLKYRAEYDFPADYESRGGLGSKVVTVNATTRTATFPSTDFLTVGQIGEYVITDHTAAQYYDIPGYTVPVAVIGRVTGYASNIVTLSEVPVNIATGTYTLYVSFYKTVGNPFHGDVTASSNIITNVEASTGGYPYRGQRLTGNAPDAAFLSNYTIVTDYDTTAKTVTVNNISGVTRKDVPFTTSKRIVINAAMLITAAPLSNMAYPLFEGTQFIAEGQSFPDGRNKTLIFHIFKGGHINQGVVGSLRQAEWAYDIDLRMGSGGLEWNNNGTWTPASPWLDNVGSVLYGGKVLVGNTGTAWRDITINKPDPVMSMSQLGTEKILLGVASGINDLIAGSVSGDFNIKTIAGKILISTDNGVTASLIFGASQAVTIPVLAGTGNRMMVANSAGGVSTQAIYSGPSVVVTATDANSTVASNTDMEILPTITAARTLTLPDPTTMAGSIKGIWNRNSTGFAWTFSSAITLPDDTTTTTIPNDSFITIQSNGVVWVKKDSAGSAANPNVVTATDADSTMAGDTDMEVLPNITANRTLTLPDPTALTGKTRRVWNKNSSALYFWTFASAITLPDDSTTTTIPDDVVITLQSNGTVWVRTDNSQDRTLTTATDTNYTMGAATDFLKLPVITANRTLTLPLAASYKGKIKTIWNTNTSGTFSWSFASAITLPDGTTSTFLPNGTAMSLQSDGSVWVQVESTYPITFYHDSTLSGSGSTSGDPIFVKGTRNYTTTARDALTGVAVGDIITNTTTGKLNWWNGTVWKIVTDS